MIDKINVESPLCKSNDLIKREIADMLIKINENAKRQIPKAVFIEAYWIYVNEVC